MPFVSTSLRLIGFALGAAVWFFLLAVLLQRRQRWLIAAVLAAGLWHLANALVVLEMVVVGDESRLYLIVVREAARVAGWIAPAALLHLALFWAAVPAWTGVLAYAAALSLMNVAGAYPWYFGASAVGSAGLILTAGARAPDAAERGFFRVFAASIALAAAGALAGGASATLAWASLAPALCLMVFILRFNLFGLLISRRIVFTLAMAAVSAVYLLLVKLISDTLEHRIEAFGPIVELVLIVSAAAIWIPLYEWLTRRISRRTEVYVDFSKRIMEEAAGILEFGQRAAFLVDGVGKTFHLRGAALATFTAPRLVSVYGGGSPPAAGDLNRLEQLLAGESQEVVHARRTPSDAMREALATAGFSYAFPLRYEGKLTGVLLADPAPRVFLDENEAILAGLVRQISHSIEACRVVDEKIALEKTLLAQEHLAALGNAAATIAHEVKNPLGSIRALAQLMTEDAEVDRQHGDGLRYIMSECDRLDSSVRQLLTFSRPASGELAEVDVSALLEAMARTLDREYSAGGVRVSASIAPGLVLEKSDSHGLQQIVLNLALNAIQASSAGGEVRLEAGRSAGGGVAIAVSDQGPGIPESLREKIFQPYYTTKQKGTGLGLPIVRKNVRRLGGRLELESPVAGGRGTRMIVTLPG